MGARAFVRRTAQANRRSAAGTSATFPDVWRTAWDSTDAGAALVLPDVDHRAVSGLKFSAALPQRLAVATAAARLADFEGARAVLAEPVRSHIGSSG